MRARRRSGPIRWPRIRTAGWCHNNLGIFSSKGQVDEAMAQLSKGPGNQPQLCRSPQQPRQSLSYKRASGRGDGPVSKGLGNQSQSMPKPTTILAMLLAKGAGGRGDCTKYQKSPGNRSQTMPMPTTISAIALFKKGQVDEAIDQFQKALRLKPNYRLPHKTIWLKRRRWRDKERGQK